MLLIFFLKSTKTIPKPMQFSMKIKRLNFNKTRIITKNHVRYKSGRSIFARLLIRFGLSIGKNEFVLVGHYFHILRFISSIIQNEARGARDAIHISMRPAPFKNSENELQCRPKLIETAL